MPYGKPKMAKDSKSSTRTQAKSKHATQLKKMRTGKSVSSTQLSMATSRVDTMQLRTGMIVSHNGKPEIIGKLEGECGNGIHFGSGCYNKYAKWSVYNV